MSASIQQKSGLFDVKEATLRTPNAIHKVWRGHMNLSHRERLLGALDGGEGGGMRAAGDKGETTGRQGPSTTAKLRLLKRSWICWSGKPHPESRCIEMENLRVGFGSLGRGRVGRSVDNAIMGVVGFIVYVNQ